MPGEHELAEAGCQGHHGMWPPRLRPVRCRITNSRTRTMTMIPNTFTQPGVRVSSPLSRFPSGDGSAMCVSSSVARRNTNFLDFDSLLFVFMISPRACIQSGSRATVCSCTSQVRKVSLAFSLTLALPAHAARETRDQYVGNHVTEYPVPWLRAHPRQRKYLARCLYALVYRTSRIFYLCLSFEYARESITSQEAKAAAL